MVTSDASSSSNNSNLGVSERALAAAGASFLSAIIVNPLDVAKTRLQAQAAGVPYHNLTHTCSFQTNTSIGYDNVQSYITSKFIVIGQQSTGYGNVQSYITSIFIVIGQQSTGYGNVQSYITSTFNMIG
nr:mitochondrial carrier protein MTM1-like isoform X1 [Tanacetum cinerariifolium]